ncbi:MAG: translocation/assembly module TamB domain-containing protein [bacterium]|nr:translocation/assembly module TamB domain-containing protein [bacterium]
MKKRIVLLLIIIGLGCLYLAWQTGLFYEPMKGQIVSQLEAETGDEVTIGDIGGGLLDHLVLYQVRFVQSSPEGEESVITIDRIAFRFSLWEIIRARGKWSPGWLKEIRLLRPKAALSLEKGKREIDWEKQWAAVINLVSFRLLIQKGELDLFDPVRDFSLPLRGIEARIEPRELGVRSQESGVRSQKGSLPEIIKPRKREDTTTLILTAACSLMEETKPPQIRLWGKATSEDLNWKAEIDSVDLAGLSSLLNQKSEVRGRKTAVGNPQSEIRNPKSEQSEIKNPKSEIETIRNLLQSAHGAIKGNLEGKAAPAGQELKLVICQGSLELKDGELILGAQGEKITDASGNLEISYANADCGMRNAEFGVPQSAICNPQSAIRNPQSAIRNPQSAIRNPQSLIRNPQSAIRNPQSAIRNPQSEIRNPKSAIRNPQFVAEVAFTARETPFKLKGEIFDLNEEIGLKLESAQVIWNKWIPVPGKNPDLAGPFSFEGSIKIKPSLCISGETALSSLSLNKGKTILPGLTANLRYQSDRLHLIRVKWGEGYLAQGELNWSGVPSCNLTLEVQNAPLRPLMKLFRLDADKSTHLNGILKVAGKQNAPVYEGDFVLTGILGGEGKCAFKGQGTRIQIASLKINQEKGRLELEGKILPPEDQKTRARITVFADRFRIGANQVSSRFDLSGEFVPEDVFAGQFKLEDNIINSISPGDMEGRITYREGRLNLFTLKSENNLFVDGGIRFNGSLGLDLNVTLRGTKLDQVGGVLGLKSPAGEVSGLVTVRRDQGKLSYRGENLKIANIAGKYTGNLSLTGDGDGLRLTLADILLSDQSRLSFPGHIRFGKPLAFSFEITAEDLAGLNGRGKIEGQIDQGAAAGRLSGFKGDLRGLPVSEGELSLKWAKDKKIVIDPLTLKIGHAGKLSATGDVFPETADIDFSLTGLNWPEAAVFYPRLASCEGSFDLKGRVAGKWLHPEVTASLKGIQDGKTVTAIFRWAANKAEIQSLRIDHSTAKGEVDFSSKALKVDLIMDGTSLSTLTAFGWPGAPEVEGVVKGKIDISGAISQPEVKGNISITDFTTPGFSFKQAAGEFSLSNRRLSVPEFNLIQDEERTVSLQGEFDLASPQKVQFEALTKEIEVAKVILGGKLTFTGEKKGGGDIPWTGKLEAENLTINREYNFEKMTSEVNYHPGKGCNFSLVEGENGVLGRIDLSTGKIRIQSLGLSRSGKKLIESEGWVDPANRQLDLILNMEELDVGVVVGYIKLISKAEGKCIGWLRITGAFDDPELSGEIQVKGASLQTAVFKERLKQLEAALRIHNNALVIDSLKAMVGKSQLIVEGAKGSTPERLDFTIHNKNQPLPVLVPGFLEGEVDINLKITGNLYEPVCARGSWIKLKKTKFTYPVKSAAPVVLEKIRWDGLKIIADKEVSYYNDYVDVEIEKGGYLEFRGRMDLHLDVVGQASARRGRFEYLGTEFRLKEAKMKFEEGVEFPYLTGTAKTEVGGERIIMVYDGKLFDSEPMFTAPGSFPPKSQQEIVQLLRMGGELGEADMESLLQIGIARLVGQSLDAGVINPLERQLSTALDIDIDIKLPVGEILKRALGRNDSLVDEDKSGKDENKVEFNLGKYVSRDLYFNYRAIVESQQKEQKRLGLTQEFELDYYLKEGESIQYQYRPDEDPEKEEHRIMLKKEFRF